MIGVLVGQGWLIQEFRQEGREANLTTNIELIDLLRKI
jgi:hypothetical protein